MSRLTGMFGWRLRRRTMPPVNEHGILQVGNDDFRRACAIHEDGTYHFDSSRSDMVWKEYEELCNRWLLPGVRVHKPVTALEIERLHGIGSAAPARPLDENGLTPGARRLITVLGEAATLDASDIKLKVTADRTTCRLKIGGAEITHGDPWTALDGDEAINWLYNQRAAGDGSSSQQKGKPQSFAVDRNSDVPFPTGVSGLRGQKGPHGDNREFVTLRMLYARDGNDAGELEELGFDTDVLEALDEERRSDNGLMIVGGSTGDGKSTTLVRQLERLYRDRDGNVSIMTVEDPVEYPIEGDGIIQLAVNTAAKGEDRRQAYAEVLRQFVRSNPDFGMVSEIRSADDANVILQFVSSGHKVFTTVHSFSANSVLFRLISLGVSPAELAEPGMVSLIMRQKLVSILCPECAIRPSEAMAARIRRWTRRDDARPLLRNREGCEVCLAGREGATAQVAWGGISRKRAVAEFIRVDDTYRSFVEARKSLEAFNYWTTPVAKDGMGGRTVDDRLRALVAAGEADYADISNDRLPPPALREVE